MENKYKDEFTIYTFSNTQQYKNNTLSEFTTVLPQPISLQGNYYVALEEIGMNYVGTLSAGVHGPAFIVGFITDYFTPHPDNDAHNMRMYDLMKQHVLRKTILPPNYSEPLEALYYIIPCEVEDSVDNLIRKFNEKKQLLTKLAEQSDVSNPFKINEFPLNVKKNDVGTFTFFNDVIKEGDDFLFNEMFLYASDFLTRELNLPIENYKYGFKFETDFNFKLLKRWNRFEEFKIESSPFDIRHVVNIHTDIIHNSITNEGYTKILRQITLPLDSNYHIKEFVSLEFIPLTTQFFTNIKFQLRCEEKSAPLSLGHPTFVKLRFKKMYTEHFHVKLTSEATTSYPLNRCHSFKVRLPEPLYLEENKWEVALTSFTSPSDKYFFYDSDIAKIEVKWDYVVERDLWLSTEKVDVLATGKSYQDAIRKLNEFLQLNDLGKVEVQKNRYVRYSIKRDCQITFPFSISKLFGYHPAALSDRVVTTTGKKIFISSHPAINLYKAPFFFIYCNIVKPRLTGETMTQLLHLIHYQKKDLLFHGRIDKEFHHRTYLDISHNPITTIECELKGMDGEYITFKKDDHITMNLEFKKKTI